MRNIIILIAVILLFANIDSYSQDDLVSKYMQMIAQGKIDEVKQQLPDLLAQYPKDPGVELLFATVITDGDKAFEKYKDILENYPESQWADDAFWRIVQYYAIKGDTAEAKKQLDLFRKKYPASEFLMPATEIVKILYTSNKKAELITAKVEKTKDKEVEKETEKPVTENEGTFGLQVGVYSTYEAAKQEVEHYKSLRMIAKIKTKKIGDETMYAVVIGNYSSKEEAEQAKYVVQQQCKCIPIVFQK